MLATLPPYVLGWPEKIPHGLQADDAHNLIDLDDSTFNEDERLATAALRDQHDAVLAELGDEHDPVRKEGKERIWMHLAKTWEN